MPVGYPGDLVTFGEWGIWDAKGGQHKPSNSRTEIDSLVELSWEGARARTPASILVVLDRRENKV